MISLNPESEQPMSTLPTDLQPFWDDLESADQRALDLSGSLTDEEFFWQPDGGRRWSVALCLDHLAVANAVYGASIAHALDVARSRGWTRQGPGRPGFFGRKFAESLEPPATRRTRAPGKIRPMAARGREEILKEYRTAHDRIRDLLRAASTADTNRATFRNPFIGFVRVKVATGFLVISAHDRRHLWQAEQVVKELRGQGRPLAHD
jgi:hypothetical protein